jgi:hypothetical protein
MHPTRWEVYFAKTGRLKTPVLFTNVVSSFREIALCFIKLLLDRLRPINYKSEPVAVVALVDFLANL